MLLQIPKSKPHLRQLVIDTVHVPCKVRDQVFIVPVDAMIGEVWDKKQMIPLKASPANIVVEASTS